MNLTQLTLIFVPAAAVWLLLAVSLLQRMRFGDLRRRLTACRGTATIEFALVFPILLFLTLVLTQTTLLMGGNIFVHYAAFAATRTAIVQIPADYGDSSGELPNILINAEGYAKHDAIQRSAAFALVPVAGRIESGPAATEPFVSGLSNYFNAYGQSTPNWVSRLAADRLRYALAKTDITVMQTVVENPDQVTFRRLPAGEPYAFGPREAVTVRVEHRLNLAIPYVGMIFADGRNEDEKDNRRYTLAAAQCTLTNEGTSDELPPLPELPRIP